MSWLSGAGGKVSAGTLRCPHSVSSKRTREAKALEWVAIPAEGARLVRCAIESSGKRGELRLEVEGHAPIHIGMAHSISFSSMNGVTQRLVALDDRSVLVMLEPGHEPVRVVEAKLLYWLPEPVEACFASAGKGPSWDPRACFDVRLGFELEAPHQHPPPLR